MTLEQLEQELAALGDECVAERVNMLRLVKEEAAWEKRQTLLARIRTVRNANNVLAEVDPLLVDLTTWRDHLEAWRKELCDRLLAFPSPLRNKEELGKRHAVELSIIQIDRGLNFHHEAFPARLPLDDLMERDGCADPRGTLAVTCAAFWKGSLGRVEKRLKELQERHDDATARLAQALRDTPALTS